MPLGLQPPPLRPLDNPTAHPKRTNFRRKNRRQPASNPKEGPAPSLLATALSSQRSRGSDISTTTIFVSISILNNFSNIRYEPHRRTSCRVRTFRRETAKCRKRLQKSPFPLNVRFGECDWGIKRSQFQTLSASPRGHSQK